MQLKTRGVERAVPLVDVQQPAVGEDVRWTRRRRLSGTISS